MFFSKSLIDPAQPCTQVVQTIMSMTGCCEFELERILDQASPTQKRLDVYVWEDCVYCICVCMPLLYV